MLQRTSLPCASALVGALIVLGGCGASTNAITRHPTATSVPFTAPFVGGPYRNFTQKYGPPFGASNDFFAPDSQHTVIFAVDTGQDTPATLVTKLAVVQVPSDWTDAQVFAECVLFLPSGATQFNQSNDLTDYHTPIGEVILQSGGGVCNLSTAPS